MRRDSIGFVMPSAGCCCNRFGRRDRRSTGAPDVAWLRQRRQSRRSAFAHGLQDRKTPAGNIVSRAGFCKLFAARQTMSLAGSVMRVCSISMTADMSRNSADTQAGSNN
jgi:hypothetical protein